MGSKEVTLGTLYMPIGGRSSPFSRMTGVSASPVLDVRALSWVLKNKEFFEHNKWDNNTGIEC